MQQTDQNIEELRTAPRRRIPPLWLLILCCALLVSAGTYVVLWRPWLQRKALVAELETLGMRVTYREAGPEWLRNLTGRGAHGLSGNPVVGGLLDQVIAVSACPSGRPRVVPREIPFELIRDLQRFQSLEHLDLTYTNVTDDWMPAIAELKSLQALEVGHARVGGRGFRVIQQLPQLDQLNLTYCPVRDEFLDDLAALPALKTVSLFRCSHLTNDAIAKLQSDRPGLHVHVDRRIHPIAATQKGAPR